MLAGTDDPHCHQQAGALQQAGQSASLWMDAGLEAGWLSRDSCSRSWCCNLWGGLLWFCSCRRAPAGFRLLTGLLVYLLPSKQVELTFKTAHTLRAKLITAVRRACWGGSGQGSGRHKLAMQYAWRQAGDSGHASCRKQKAWDC